jgi:hypothetical protein
MPSCSLAPADRGRCHRACRPAAHVSLAAGGADARHVVTSPWEGARGRAGWRTCRPCGGGAGAKRRKAAAVDASARGRFVWVTGGHRVTAGTSQPRRCPCPCAICLGFCRAPCAGHASVRAVTCGGKGVARSKRAGCFRFVPVAKLPPFSSSEPDERLSDRSRADPFCVSLERHTIPILTFPQGSVSSVHKSQ